MIRYLLLNITQYKSAFQLKSPAHLHPDLLTRNKMKKKKPVSVVVFHYNFIRDLWKCSIGPYKRLEWKLILWGFFYCCCCKIMHVRLGKWGGQIRKKQTSFIKKTHLCHQ